MVLLFARLIESSIIGVSRFCRRRIVAKSSSLVNASTIMATTAVKEEIINKRVKFWRQVRDRLVVIWFLAFWPVGCASELSGR